MSDHPSEPGDDAYVEREPPAAPPPGNRPGQPAISFRLGTHGSFLARMRAAFERPAPSRETEARRLPEDHPAVALFDTWATVAHVLSFYQERIANEGYLNTAVEPLSVRELARTLGYELKPGVAASAPLAFTVDDAPGAPEEALIPERTRVQSLPTDGALPQTFETIEPFTARVQWNTLRPLREQPQRIEVQDGWPVFVGLDGARVRARRLYLAGALAPSSLVAGDLLLLIPPGELGGDSHVPPVALEARAVVTRDAAGVTEVVIEDAPQALPPLTLPWPASKPLALAKAAPARPPASSPASPSPPPPPPPPPLAAGLDVAIADEVLRRAWHERDLQGFLTKRHWEPRLVERLAATLPRPWPPTEPAPAPRLLALRTRAGLFGQDAPAFTYDEKGKPVPVFAGEEPGIWELSRPGTQNRVHLDAVYPGVAAGDWVILEQHGADPATTLRKAYQVERVSEVRRVVAGQSGRVTALDLERGAGDSEGERFHLFGTSVYLRGEPLTLGRLPIPDPVAGRELVLDGLVLGLRPGRPLVLTGEREDARGLPHQALVTLETVRHFLNCTVLGFTAPLEHRFVRGTVSLTANVVRATHGETTEEVLGSGGGTLRHQRFPLKKQPLTYVAAPNATGVASTLTVRVSGVTWRETPALAGEGPESECYQVQHQEGGATAVLFGDGQNGARLPSGQENVVATYRSGLGSGGEIPAGGLILLSESPAGIRSVTNPLPATGAADPETMDQARRNAPRTVRTIARVVSLQDFTDFASTFPGVGKALTQSFHDPGRGRLLVHVTVAGANGAAVDPGSALHEALLQALYRASDPALRRKLRVLLGSFEPRYFNLKAALRLDPRFEEAAVRAAAEGALRRAFSFARRDFAQPLTWSEVVATLCAVPGVEAARVEWPPFEPAQPYDPSSFSSGPDRRDDVLAAPARREGDRIAPAQLLLVNPAGIQLERWEVTP